MVLGENSSILNLIFYTFCTLLYKYISKFHTNLLHVLTKYLEILFYILLKYTRKRNRVLRNQELSQMAKLYIK